MKNVREKIQELLDRKRSCLPWKEEKSTDSPTRSLSGLPWPEDAEMKGKTNTRARKKNPSRQRLSPQVDPRLSANEQRRALNREKRYERYEAVKALRAQGLSHYAIAEAIGLSRPTVRFFLNAEHFPERQDSSREPHKSIVAPYLPFLRERWLAGCHNGRQLFREARDRDYMGSRAQLERVTTEWRKYLASPVLGASASPSPKRQRLSSQQASWYFVMRKEQLTPEQHRQIEHLCQASPDLALAYELSQNFQRILRERTGGELNGWLRQAKESRIAEFRSLAKSMQQDSAAIAAACSLPWNQGQVEGQINRLKWLKRQMYGRANFDLLRLRVLQAS